MWCAGGTWCEMRMTTVCCAVAVVANTTVKAANQRRVNDSGMVILLAIDGVD